MTLLWWLRHVTLPGLAMGSLLLSAYLSLWFLLARWMLPKALAGGFWARFLSKLILASAWTFIEWARCQFTLGFPWCPLSVSQWQRPAILQGAEWLGGWWVSFLLVFFNLCIASYLHHLLVRRLQSRRGGILGSFCPDFYAGLLMLCVALAPFFLKTHEGDSQRLLRAGFVQPYLLDKWMPGKASIHKETLRNLTLVTSAARPDLILWPEASTPYAITEDRAWVEAISKRTNTPMLVGAVAKSPNKDYSYNAVCLVTPEDGLDLGFYAKRVLVPFGEYVPAGLKWIPGLDKLVGPTGSFEAGGDSRLLKVDLNSTKSGVKIGSLICYEDIFPSLARRFAVDGSDFLFVCTNNAWFGEEGCAEQHAAHSVLRAIENRLPVLRCGNAGWSGWIDERGNLRATILNEEGSVYFEGAATFEVSRQGKSTKKLSFYTRHGDFFPYLCIAMALAGSFILSRAKIAQRTD